jgi:hypothetical protein
MSAALVAAHKTVEQLRAEASLNRVKISESAGDLLRYCQDKQRDDPLVSGIAPSDNPYKDNKVCSLI